MDEQDEQETDGAVCCICRLPGGPAVHARGVAAIQELKLELGLLTCPEVAST